MIASPPKYTEKPTPPDGKSPIPTSQMDYRTQHSPNAMEPRVLSEQVLYQNGSYSRVRRYLEGWHPELGLLHLGLTGTETIRETDVIRPIRTYNVV